ncbi:MAG: AI-2E family transporter [Acidobacteriota bacterium]|nr:AI-2E family transporter [Acidobacteriota bacterium]
MARPHVQTPTLSPLVGFAIAVAILYFARDLLQPFAFALLLAFLLSPIVKRLEGWRIHRVPAAMLVFLLASALVAVLGWVVANQLIQIVEGLPRFSDNVHRKVVALQGQSKSLSDVIANLEDMGRLTGAAPVSHTQEPMPVVVIEQHNIVQTLRDYAGGLLKPLGTIALIMVFTIFMLIDQEGLRNRLLRLIGQQKLQATTKAMDDAGQRVSRYVLLQFAVNGAFGAVIALGLFLLHVPSFLLWGVLGVFLRFLPYIGPAVAGFLPFVLTLAVTDGWRTPLSVVGLFFITEAIIGNFVEPLLYGVHTGLSAVAILVSAVFWTVLWGPVGLVLSTPLTVCLSVLGRHSPQLEFLNIVLGDEPVLTAEVIFYQRLLALDQQDALNVLDGLAKEQPLITIFDNVVLPALAMAERDRHTGQLDAKREEFIVQSINEFVTELAEAETADPAEGAPRKTRVFCVPAHDAADEIAAAMCAHFLNQEKFPAIAFPVTDSPGQLMKTLAIQPEDVVCISAVPPFAAGNARKIAKDIRENGCNPLIVAGLWTYNSTSQARLERLKKSLSLIVATSLAEVVAQVREIDQPEPKSLEL